MKKLLALLVVLVIVVFVLPYLFIPNKIAISSIAEINASEKATYRTLTNENNWQKWWPSNSSLPNSKSFIYKEDTFQLQNKYMNAMEILIKEGDSTYSSVMSFIPIRLDSARIEWRTFANAGNNPFSRIKKYFVSRSIKRNMVDLLNTIKFFVEKQENVYGMEIKQEKVKDTILVSTKTTTKEYPSVEEIYTLIGRLRDYIKANNAAETNYPMLHVEELRANGFQTMVAIPVDKNLPATKNIAPKRMVAGNILAAEVKGGTATLKKALNELENYVFDYQRVSPAIPFESLIIDRLKEKDTTKWVTKIYYPVF